MQVTYPYINPTAGLANDTNSSGPTSTRAAPSARFRRPASARPSPPSASRAPSTTLTGTRASWPPSPATLTRSSTPTTASTGSPASPTSRPPAGAFLPTFYDYDLAGNLADVRYPGNSGAAYDKLVYGYDDDGNLTQRTDGNGVVTNYLRDTVGATAERPADGGSVPRHPRPQRRLRLRRLRADDLGAEGQRRAVHDQDRHL